MHISTRLIIGGSQETTLLCCRGQADRGHTVALAFGPIFGPEGSLRPHAEQDGRIELFEVPHLVREISPVADVLAYRELRRLIRRWNPDVVHTHSSKAGIVGRLAAWHESVPTVVHTVHGFAFDEHESPWRARLYATAERLAARRCHRMIFVSEALRDEAIAQGIGRTEQFSVVYAGLGVEAFLSPEQTRAKMRESLGIGEDDFVCGTVARLVDLKGHDDLLQALAPVVRDVPSTKLLWVGDGWLRDQLEETIERQGMSENVIMTGLVAPEQIPGLISGMDVLVHPSHREGMGRAIVEASLSEVPIVAYEVGGVPEVCVDGITGILVRPVAPEGLEQGVRWMMEHPQERAAMGRAGREHCLRRFSADLMVETIEAIYAGAG